MLMNYLVFACQSNPLSLLHDNPSGYSILGSRFFPFSTSNASCHSLLACSVSADKSADSLTRVPLYALPCFFLVAVTMLSLTFPALIMICLIVSLLGFIVSGTLCTSWTWVCFLVQIQEVFSIISSNTFWSPFLSLLLCNPDDVNISIFNVILEMS